jgi:hypothetical protein
MMFISLVTDIREVLLITKSDARPNARPPVSSPTPNIEIFYTKFYQNVAWFKLQPTSATEIER